MNCCVVSDLRELWVIGESLLDTLQDLLHALRFCSLLPSTRSLGLLHQRSSLSRNYPLLRLSLRDGKPSVGDFRSSSLRSSAFLNLHILRSWNTKGTLDLRTALWQSIKLTSIRSSFGSGFWSVDL